MIDNDNQQEIPSAPENFRSNIASLPHITREEIDECQGDESVPGILSDATRIRLAQHKLEQELGITAEDYTPKELPEGRELSQGGRTDMALRILRGEATPLEVKIDDLRYAVQGIEVDPKEFGFIIGPDGTMTQEQLAQLYKSKPVMDAFYEFKQALHTDPVIRFQVAD